VSKARLVIAAVVLEGRPAAEVCTEYRESNFWLYELLAHSELCSCRDAATVRIASSRNSGGYRVDDADDMTPSS
jgi:hypothetical protein